MNVADALNVYPFMFPAPSLILETSNLQFFKLYQKQTTRLNENLKIDIFKRICRNFPFSPFETEQLFESSIINVYSIFNFDSSSFDDPKSLCVFSNYFVVDTEDFTPEATSVRLSTIHPMSFVKTRYIKGIRHYNLKSLWARFNWNHNANPRQLCWSTQKGIYQVGTRRPETQTIDITVENALLRLTNVPTPLQLQEISFDLNILIFSDPEGVNILFMRENVHCRLPEIPQDFHVYLNAQDSVLIINRRFFTRSLNSFKFAGIELEQQPLPFSDRQRFYINRDHEIWIYNFCTLRVLNIINKLDLNMSFDFIIDVEIPDRQNCLLFVDRASQIAIEMEQPDKKLYLDDKCMQSLKRIWIEKSRDRNLQIFEESLEMTKYSRCFANEVVPEFLLDKSGKIELLGEFLKILDQRFIYSKAKFQMRDLINRLWRSKNRMHMNAIINSIKVTEFEFFLSNKEFLRLLTDKSYEARKLLQLLIIQKRNYDFETSDLEINYTHDSPPFPNFVVLQHPAERVGQNTPTFSYETINAFPKANRKESPSDASGNTLLHRDSLASQADISVMGQAPVVAN